MTMRYAMAPEHLVEAVRLNPLAGLLSSVTVCRALGGAREHLGASGVVLSSLLPNNLHTTQPLAGRLSSALASGEETGLSAGFRF